MHTSLAETTPSSIAQAGASAMRSAEPARLDLYLSIHKALRSFMSDTLVRVGRIDVADAADRDAALAQLDRLLELYARAASFANVSTNIRLAQRALNQVEQRLEELANPPAKEPLPWA